MKGSVDKDLLVFVAVFIGLGVLWILMGRPATHGVDSPFVRFRADSGIRPSIGGSSGQGGVNQDKTGDKITSEFSNLDSRLVTINGYTYEKSPWYESVKISRGSAASADLAREEYIILTADRRGKQDISVSGWILENGRNRKLTNITSYREAVLKAQTATIPQAAALFLGEDSVPGPVTLAPGARAYIITGSLRTGGDLPVRIGFRTNKCIGYLTDNQRNDFIPSLRASCPNPAAVAGVDGLSDSCYRFVRRLRACHVPNDAPYRDRDGELVRNHLDGDTTLSRTCQAWIKERFHYKACVGRHIADPDFYGNEWRVYLNRTWELWDNNREVITLYDSAGRLVHQLSY
jgi:hypothetical protein